MNRFLRLLRRREGFSRLEFLIVLVILLIVVAIAGPSVLGSSGDAKDARASADVATAVMSAAAFYADNETYEGLSGDAVRTGYVESLSPDVSIVAVNGNRNFCVSVPGRSSTVWYFYGPDGKLTSSRPLFC